MPTVLLKTLGVVGMVRSGIIVVWMATIVASCTGSRAIESSDAGRTRAYEPGIPNFDMETVVRPRDDSLIVEAHLSMPLSSLVFVRDGDDFAAEYELVAEVIDRESKAIVTDLSKTESIRVSAYDSTISTVPRVWSIDLDAPPGSHVVQITLTDAATGESATRRQAVSIPDPLEDDLYVSRIYLEAQREGRGFEPLVSLHLPAMMDSLRASIQLLNSGAAPLNIRMELVSFRTDTSVAAPPYALVPSRASLAHRGVLYDEADTLQVTRRELTSAEGGSVVEFSLPQLSRGMFGLNIEATNDEGDVIIERDRLLSVKNETFPQIALLDDLIEALAYIAYESEVEHIRAGGTPAEKKRRFDAFWGSLVPNRNAAANLIKLYYGRIEEANLYFTAYKEGWKTDRGMIYVVLGPPLYVERRVDSETWHYSYSEQNPLRTFVFDEAQEFRDDPFDHFILERRAFYHQTWNRALDLWRSGDVL